MDGARSKKSKTNKSFQKLKGRQKIKEEEKLRDKEPKLRDMDEIYNLLDTVIPLYPIAAKNAAGPILKRKSSRIMFSEILQERLPGITNGQIEEAIKERFDK